MRLFISICFVGLILGTASCGRGIADSEPVITQPLPLIEIGSNINEVRSVYGTPDQEGYDYHDIGFFDDNGIIRYDYAMHYNSLNLTFWLDKNWPRLVTHIDGDL